MVMEKILKSITILSMLVITLGSLIYYINPALYNATIQEDALIENITAFALLAFSMILLFRLIKVWNSKNVKWIIFNIIIISILFFGFGEEISWGQRIFSIESNEYFSENNLQGETNLHNLKLFGLKVNEVVFTYVLGLVFGFYIFLSSFFYKKTQYFRNIINKYGIPLPRIQHSIGFVIATLIITAIPHSRVWERWECFNVLLLFLIFLQPYNVNEKLLQTKKKIFK